MNKEILRLAIPNILSNISVPLLSSFDTILMGGISQLHIAAIGMGSMAFNFIYWNCGFLRMAGTGLTAQAYGRENRREMTAILGRGLLVATALAVLFMLLQQPILAGVNGLLNIQPEHEPLVQTYFFIRIWAAPAALGLMVLFGWYFGMQNALFPLLLTLLINAVNMGVSYWLVHYANWGVAGVAWGTVIAQYAGFFAAFGLLAYRYGWLKDYWQKAEILLRDQLLGFLRINGDIFIRTLCLTLSFALFYNWANAGQTAAVIAANVILLQLVNWMSYGVDGFAFAAESLVGKYHGAQQEVNLRKSIKLSFVWGMILALLYALIYLGLGRAILELFAPEENAAAALATAQEYLPFIAAFCILATPCYIYDGIYIGLTAAKEMRTTMIIAFAAYLLTYYCYGQYHGNWGLWVSLLAFMVYRALMQGIWLWRGKLY